MTNKFYAEIFNHSGASYHRAMQLYPAARDQEFTAVCELFNLNAGDKIIDVPAGGGYLRRYLPQSVEYIGLEFSNGFGDDEAIDQCGESSLPFADASVDVVVCLAALHHIEEKAAFFAELARCLTPSGQLVIADVLQHSKPAIFLNGFVDKWNSLGHNGDFIDLQREQWLLEHAGFAVQSVQKHYQWVFGSRAECHDYLRLLFSLDKQPSEQQLDAALAELGSEQSKQGFSLNWSLCCLQGQLKKSFVQLSCACRNSKTRDRK